MSLAWKALTIVAGAMPATYLCYLAAIAVWIGILGTIGGDSTGLILAAWGLMGLYGTASLWAVGFGYLRRFTVIGLVIGILAIMPFLGFLLPFGGVSEILLAGRGFVFLGPFVVAVGWLLALAFQAPLPGPVAARTASE